MAHLCERFTSRPNKLHSTACSLHAAVHRCSVAVTLSILHERVVGGNLQSSGLLLTLEGDLHHRTILFYGEDSDETRGLAVLQGRSGGIISVVCPANIVLVL